MMPMHGDSCTPTLIILSTAACTSHHCARSLQREEFQGILQSQQHAELQQQQQQQQRSQQQQPRQQQQQQQKQQQQALLPPPLPMGSVASPFKLVRGALAAAAGSGSRAVGSGTSL